MRAEKGRASEFDAYQKQYYPCDQHGTQVMAFDVTNLRVKLVSLPLSQMGAYGAFLRGWWIEPHIYVANIKRHNHGSCACLKM